ncbi:outer membrane beta-barrel family protein [Phocaeicola vulgatus]|mgnify:FL=1|nr:outer membrane beta-barrel family protein [Phocaeicola vulgatus]
MKQWFSLDAAGQRRTYNNPLFVGSLNNTFTLPAGFLLSADFNYQSRGQVQNITLKRPQYTLNIGLRKSLFNDALSIEARANDLLLGCKQEALLYMESAQMKDLSWSDTRSFSLTVRYKFNAAKSKYKGTGAGQDTINRM